MSKELFMDIINKIKVKYKKLNKKQKKVKKPLTEDEFMNSLSVAKSSYDLGLDDVGDDIINRVNKKIEK